MLRNKAHIWSEKIDLGNHGEHFIIGGNSSDDKRIDVRLWKKRCFSILIVLLLLVLLLLLSVGAWLMLMEDDTIVAPYANAHEQAVAILGKYPVIDG